MRWNKFTNWIPSNRASIRILLMEKGIKELPTMEILQFFLIPYMPTIKSALVCMLELLESVCLSHCWTKCDCLLSMQFLDCDALPNADCTWCEWISGCEERRVILITPGSEFGHGWWRIHQVKIELYNFWQDSNTELNHLGHRTKKIIVPKQFLIPIKRESFFIERLLLQKSFVLV